MGIASEQRAASFAKTKNKMWSSKMESEAANVQHQPIKRVQLVCCDIGETLGSKALPCGPCGETVWTEVSSSTTTFGMIWFLCCICSIPCIPCAFLPFWMKNFKKFHHKCSKCGNQLETVHLPWTRGKIALAVIGCIVCFLFLFLFLYMGLKYLGLYEYMNQY